MFFQDSVLVSVDQSIPSPLMQDTVILCQNDTLLLAPSNVNNAIWFPNTNLISLPQLVL